AVLGTAMNLRGGITVANENITLTDAGAANINVSTSTGQLGSTNGNNTWAGNVVIAGSANGVGNGTGAGLVAIGAASGTTLTISGVISGNSDAGPVVGTWTKVGTGTVVLTGSSPNTFGGFTRVFNGALVVEKDGAFGAPGVDGFVDTAVLINS